MRSPATRCTCGREGSPVALSLERTEAWRRDARGVSRQRRPLNLATRSTSGMRAAINGTGLLPVRALWRVLDAHVGARFSPWPPGGARVPPVWLSSTRTDPIACALLDAGQWRPTVEADDPEVHSYHLPRWCSVRPRTLTAIVADHQRATTKKARPGRPGRGRLRGAPVPNRTHDLPDVGPQSKRGSKTSRPGPPRSLSRRGGDRPAERTGSKRSSSGCPPIGRGARCSTTT